jgi:hypothetical protein
VKKVFDRHLAEREPVCRSKRPESLNRIPALATKFRHLSTGCLQCLENHILGVPVSTALKALIDERLDLGLCI